MSNHELNDRELFMIGAENLRNLGPVDPEVAADIGYVPFGDMGEHIAHIPEHKAQIAAALGHTAAVPEMPTPIEAPEADHDKTWNINWSDQTPEQKASAQDLFKFVREALAKRNKE